MNAGGENLGPDCRDEGRRTMHPVLGRGGRNRGGTSPFLPIPTSSKNLVDEKKREM